MEVPSRHDTEFDIKARDLAEHHRRVAGEGEEEFCIRIERYPAQPAHVVLVAQTELDVVLGVKITGWTDEGHVLDPGYPVLIPIWLEQVAQPPREAAGHGWRRRAGCLSLADRR